MHTHKQQLSKLLRDFTTHHYCSLHLLHRSFSADDRKKKIQYCYYWFKHFIICLKSFYELMVEQTRVHFVHNCKWDDKIGCLNISIFSIMIKIGF